MQAAIALHVDDGMTLAIEGFTAFSCFAAAHEIIRQGRRNLTLARLTPDLIYDQMVAAGTASRMIFSYMGNPGVGALHCIRRAVEQAYPSPLALEEYSHYGIVGRYIAGASKLPFFPLRSYTGSDMAGANERIKFVDSPYGDGSIAVVPPLNPDVTIIHAQRCDAAGNTQLWGLLGVQKEAAFAANKVIVVVEELVSEETIRADPNRTLIPGLIVDAIVVEPFGAHPSYVQGYYDRDNAFYIEWDRLSRSADATEDWMDEWVYGVTNRSEYFTKLGPQHIATLKPASAPAGSIDYGSYR